MNPKFYKKFRGFSVAEAMVTLLIVSIALSAIAPIFSKRNSATLNTQSKWEKTTNGNITRVNGRVGIGHSNADEPAAKLFVTHTPDNGANNFPFLRIAQSAISLLEFTTDRILALNTVDNNRAQVMSVRQSGIERLKIESDGVVTWLDNSNPQVEKARINADGSATFGVPAGAVMFFDLDACPNGWTALTTTYSTSNGAFVRNLDNSISETRGVVEAHNVPQGYTAMNAGSGTTFYAMEESGAIVPKSIALLACKKDAY